jgi:hypothetical protein
VTLTLKVKLRCEQVDMAYHNLVMGITNADTVITLVVPSVLILVSNIRISCALSQFNRARQQFDVDDHEPATSSSLSGRSCSTGHRGRIILQRTSTKSACDVGPSSVSSRNSPGSQLQMKVHHRSLPVTQSLNRTRSHVVG